MKKEELEKISEMVTLLLASKVPFEISYNDFHLTTYKEEILEDSGDNVAYGSMPQLAPTAPAPTAPALIAPAPTAPAPIAPTPKKDYSALDALYNTPKTEDEIAKETEERNRKLKERFDKTGNVEPAVFNGD